MSTRWFGFAALDTLFFRDGRPFNQGEGSSGVAGSTFPPHPSTVVGALRAALARARGWRAGPWDDELMAVLGNGEDLNRLRVSGPYLVRTREGGRTLLYRAPLNVATSADGATTTLGFLTPGREVQTDLGRARLPSASRGSTAKQPLEGRFVTAEDLERLLRQVSSGVSPVAEAALFQAEVRTGIVREDPTSRTTGDNALFTARHVRPRPDVELLVGVDGLPSDWEVDTEPVPLGGEGRGAWLYEIPEPIGRPGTPSELVGAEHYTLTLLTPAKLPTGVPRAGAVVSGFPGTMVSACVGKPVQIGGWSSIARQSTAMEDYLPAGSTFFMQAPSALARQDIDRLSGVRLGERTAWGYGEVAIGLWREQQA